MTNFFTVVVILIITCQTNNLYGQNDDSVKTKKNLLSYGTFRFPLLYLSDQFAGTDFHVESYHRNYHLLTYKRKLGTKTSLRLGHAFLNGVTQENGSYGPRYFYLSISNVGIEGYLKTGMHSAFIYGADIYLVSTTQYKVKPDNRMGIAPVIGFYYSLTENFSITTELGGGGGFELITGYPETNFTRILSFTMGYKF